MRKLLIFGLALFAIPLWGDITLVNNPALPNGGDLANQVFTGGYANFSNYVVSDITVPAGGWDITKGIWYVHHWGASSSLPSTIPVVLNIFALTGSLPTASDTPSAAQLSATFTDLGTNTNGIRQGSLELDNIGFLGAGSWWIGITPILDFTIYGQLGDWAAAAQMGQPDAWINPGGNFSLGTSWMPAQNVNGPSRFTDAAFELYGTGSTGAVPEPATVVGVLTVAAVLGIRSRMRRIPL